MSGVSIITGANMQCQCAVYFAKFCTNGKLQKNHGLCVSKVGIDNLLLTYYQNDRLWVIFRDGWFDESTFCPSCIR